MLKMTVNKGEVTVEACGSAVDMIAELTIGSSNLLVHIASLVDDDPAILLEMLRTGLEHSVEKLSAEAKRQGGKEVKPNAVQTNQEPRRADGRWC